MKYTNAAEFVADYIENLSVGGLFIAGAHVRDANAEIEIDVELPGQGSWRVKARAVFRLEPEAAKQRGRRAGIGFKITEKPPGYDDALLGYLLRLGRRRDLTVMAGDIAGRQQLVDSGYVIVPLAVDAELALALADDKLVAIAVPAELAEALRGYGGGDRIIGIATADDIPDLIARLDSML